MPTTVNGARGDARRIAATLRSHRDAILDRWIELAKNDVEGVPRAARLDREGLLDYVPALLDNVTDALERIDPTVDATVAARDSGALDAAIRHAEHRFAQGYSISEVIRELGHFRIAILELCSREGTPLFGPAGRLAHALIDHAIGGGAATMESHERKLIEADKARVEELARAKDDFISLVSHELRTPLNVILGWSQLARARPDLDPTVANALEVIKRNAVLQARLIDDLLDLTRIRNRKIRLELRTLDPLDALRAAIDDVRPMAVAKKIEVELHAQPGAPRVCADHDRLHQVFANLLANAIKFTPTGGHVDVTATRADGSLRVAVHDTGVGIAPELLPGVFDPFRQGDPEAGKRKAGVGLGLAIVHELVRLHGGRAFAESPGVGRGSTFVVELPAGAEASLSPSL